MGQKVNPISLRLGINRTWDSRWFAEDDYADLSLKDILSKIKEKSNNIANAVAELEKLIGKVEE